MGVGTILVLLIAAAIYTPSRAQICSINDGFTATSTAIVSLVATLDEAFIAELYNRSSDEYKKLKTQVLTMCDLIFIQAFRANFINTTIVGFSPHMGNTTVEVALEFSNTSSYPVPEDELLVETLVQVANNSCNPFKLAVDPESIAVIQPETTTRVSTTQGPTTTLVPPTNGPTTAVTSVPSPVVSIEATIEEPFVPEFNDPNSEQYQSLQTQVISMCDFIFFETFGSIFFRTIVIGFRTRNNYPCIHNSRANNHPGTTNEWTNNCSHFSSITSCVY
ncbi:uncharacterized protein LOC133560905 [Nerophis ophidion]|uniref:uncharacterized protein LOC133560905 n=1 Tax=Nerophis ophidion TaxID=159077 RepID=UPI002ADFDFDA|nr:uncharacterized protein LOC133560905 [Nerophis ophidion]